MLDERGGGATPHEQLHERRAQRPARPRRRLEPGRLDDGCSESVARLEAHVPHRQPDAHHRLVVTPGLDQVDLGVEQHRGIDGVGGALEHGQRAITRAFEHGAAAADHGVVDRALDLAAESIEVLVAECVRHRRGTDLVRVQDRQHPSRCLVAAHSASC